MARVLLAAAALQLAARAASEHDHDDPFELLRTRARTLMCWPPADALTATAAAAAAVAATLNTSCFWPDVNYDDPSDRADWRTFTHLARVVTMVEAITAPGSPAFEDARLSSAAHCALDVWLAHGWTNTNWWCVAVSVRAACTRVRRAAAVALLPSLPRRCAAGHSRPRAPRPPPALRTPSPRTRPLALRAPSRYQWIGGPLSLGCAYLMLGANRTSPQEQALLTRYSYNATWWEDDYGGGANLSDMLRVQLMRSLASANATGIAQAFDVMWGNVQVGNATSNWQGIVQDGSFHFHGEDNLASAYGAVWLADQLKFYYVAGNSSYALPPARVAVLAYYLATGVAASTFGSGYDWLTQGRGIDRPGMAFSWGLAADQLRDVAREPQAAPWAPAIANLADKLAGVPGAPSLPLNRHFWNSDYHVHRRSTWGASLRMHSNKTAARYEVVASECDNSEDTKAEHFGDGVLNLFSGGMGGNAVLDAYYEIFPLLDWQGLNGITVEHDVPIEPCSMASGDQWALKWTQYVGGVSDGLYGAAAMDTATHALTARRAWFFFDSVVLALAANISDPTPARVRTALASRLMPDGNTTVAFANGSAAVVLGDGAYAFDDAAQVAWLQGAGVGCVPHVPALAPGGVAAPALGFEFSVKTGNWSSIGAYPGSVTARTLAAWLDHGQQPAGGGYAYLHFPNASAADMAALAPAWGGLGCGHNSAQVQGAAAVGGARGVDADLMQRAGAGGAGGTLTQAVFWDAAGVFACTPLGGPTGDGAAAAAWPLAPGSSLAVSTPAMVIVARNASAVTVTVSNPVVVGGTVVVALGGLAAAAGGPCAADGRGGTLVTVAMPADADFMGSSTTVSCAM